MTTICCNRQEMAADRQVTDGSKKYHAAKIFEVNGSIIGMAGTVQNTNKFRQWFRRECPDTDLIETEKEESAFEVLVLNAKGIFYYSNLTEPDELDDPFYAIGSGGDHALTAMARGATPEEAVKAAHKFDSNTGADVDVLQVPEAKKRPKKTPEQPDKVTS